MRTSIRTRFVGLASAALLVTACGGGGGDGGGSSAPPPPGSGSTVVELAEGDNDIVVEVTAANGSTKSYTITVTRQLATSFALDAYLKASNAELEDQFGFSVAISGDTLAVGALFESSNGLGGEADNSALNAGAVYVFD
jgi:hypothetical protein